MFDFFYILPFIKYRHMMKEDLLFIVWRFTGRRFSNGFPAMIVIPFDYFLDRMDGLDGLFL